MAYLDILICHPDVVRIGSQIFWRRHDGELDRPFIAEGLVCPFSYGSDFLDSRNTVVGD